MGYQEDLLSIVTVGKQALKSLKALGFPKKQPKLTDSSFRSFSDNGSYPELALKAGLNARLFSAFRRHSKYIPILEHVSKIHAEKYLDIILTEYGFSVNQIIQTLSSLSYIGNPKLERVRGLPEPISTTALRYLKVALDIKALNGDELGHVVEIGCGYGGQALVLDKVAKIASYTFVDLWQVNMLIKRFIESSSFSSKYSLSTLRDNQKGRKSWDLVISNYAFSEFPKSLQEYCLSEIISNSKNGYMTMNSGLEGGFCGIKNMSKDEIKGAIPGAMFSEERPLTGSRNYIVAW